MAGKVIKQTNVFAFFFKLDFLNFPSVTHQGGCLACQAVSEAEAWNPAALRAERASGPGWKSGLELI